MVRVRSIAAAFLRWLKPSSSRSEEAEHLALGRRGEEVAAAYLRKKGCKILRRNFTAGPGSEVDIVCRDKRSNQLVFVEVKTRTREDFGRPAQAVNHRKRRAIIRGAMRWLRLLGMPDVSFRFDIIEVVAGADERRLHRARITHLENAFPMPKRFAY